MSPIGATRLRSVLFAPAVRPDFLARLPQRGADAVVIDCEDATPSTAKSQARVNVRDVAPALLSAGCPVTVRVNSVTSEWFADDVAHGLFPGLAAVVVPKVEDLAGLDAVAAALDAAGHDTVGVIAGIETALGVADVRPLLAHQRVVGTYFGAEDFIADMGGVRTGSNDEVAFARAAVALAARLAGVPALDQVVTNFGDDQRFRVEAAQARALGYAGKMCIHPAQVPLANAAFVPTADELDRARRLLAAFERALAEGRSVFDFEGQMVDEPLVVQARRILSQAT